VPWLPLPDDRDDEPATVGTALDRVVSRLGGTSADTVTRLHDGWESFVGARLAAHTRPVSLRDGVLVVGVDDPAWSTEVRFLSPTMIERIRVGLGGVAVTSVEVRVRPRSEG
jgi:predicted nucleic acid-binding Zn ribbon protein